MENSYEEEGEEKDNEGDHQKSPKRLPIYVPKEKETSALKDLVFPKTE